MNDDTDTSEVIEVTCGDLQGLLHKELFICPGIHQECIEFQGVFTTPKIFSVMGNKTKLKDWKNAIRIKGRKIRKCIENGTLTFYNHEEYCTGRCVSRQLKKSADGSMMLATLSPKSIPVSLIKNSGEAKTISLLDTLSKNNVMFIQNIDRTKGLHVPEHAYCHIPIPPVKGEQTVTYDGSDQEDNLERKPDIETLQKMMLAKEDLKAAESSADSVNDDNDDDRMFWKGIVELGLADSFFREIKSSIDVLKNSMIKNYVPTEDAKQCTRVVTELGLMSKLKHRLAAHKTDMEKQQLKLDREMDELRRKVLEYEQKKEVLKRKSECFDQLMVMKSEKRQCPDPDSCSPSSSQDSGLSQSYDTKEES